MQLEKIKSDFPLLVPVDSSQVSTQLELILNSVEILLPGETLNEDGEFVKNSLKGIETLELILQYGAATSKVLASVLELLSYATNPAYASKFSFLRLDNGSYRSPTFDELCGALKIRPANFIAEVLVAARSFGLEQAKLIVDASAGRVALAAVENAVSGGFKGFKDRQLILQGAGIVTQTAGPQVNISNVVNNISTQPGEAQGLPPWKPVSEVIAVEGELL